MTIEEIRDRVQNHKTPLYVFDMSVLKERIDFLRDQLPKKVEICYAVKANPFLIKEISQWVDQLEICSPGEYRICQNLCVPADKYVISGVYKDAETIREIVKTGQSIGCFTVESKKQFELLREIAREHGKRFRLLLRLTSGNQFGLDGEELMEIIRHYGRDRYCHIRGIQFYSGTQKSSIKKIRRELLMLDRFLEELYQRYVYVPEVLELGLGFPVSYFQGEDFDEKAFLSECCGCLSELDFSGKIVLELGRSISAVCGSYWTRVVDVKCNLAGRFAITDGGIHQLTYYGQFMAMKHPEISIFPERPDDGQETWNICGALCTVNDILIKQYPATGLQTGDMLMFKNAGAYCVTEGIALFLSRDLPAVLLLDANGKELLVREHTETYYLNTPDYNKQEGE